MVSSGCTSQNPHICILHYLQGYPFTSSLNRIIPSPYSLQLSQAGDIILEVYLEQKNPDCCVTLKVSNSPLNSHCPLVSLGNMELRSLAFFTEVERSAHERLLV